MENREIILNLLKNERLKPSSTFIGHEGDHLCTTLKVTHNDAFDDFKVHLKFENVDKTFLSKSLTYSGGDYYDGFKVPQSILKKGNVLCQLLFLKPIENLENLDEESADNLVIRQSSIVTFNCGAKIATAAEGIDPNVGLIQFITDGDGTKFLSDNGKYYYINNNNDLLEKINNKQEKLTAGDNIIIDENNIISANKVDLSGYATKDYVEQEIANFDFIKIVTELPATGLVNRTYFVPKIGTETNDLYDEYMWVDGKWELISTKQIEVDLSQYYTKTQIDNIVNEIQSKIVNDNDITDIESFELADNTEYRFKQKLSSIAFTIPIATSDDYISSIVFKSGATATTITYPDTIKWTGDDISSNKFVPASSKTYEVLIYWNGINYCGIVKGW